MDNTEPNRVPRYDECHLILLECELNFSPSAAVGLVEEMEEAGYGYAEVAEGVYALTPYQVEQLRSLINERFDKVLYESPEPE